MVLFKVVIRTLFFYFFITISYRLMGKREVGQLGVIDLIVSILIAELVAISIENHSDPMYLTIIPISILVLLEIVLAYISIKCRHLRLILDGKPSLIINEKCRLKDITNILTDSGADKEAFNIISQGKINYHEMIKQRYTLDDLLLSLRQKEIRDISDVEFAFLEPNGQLSIFKYKPLKMKGNYPMPIIIDGNIDIDALKNIKKSESWIKNALENEDILLSEIFYAFYKNKKLYIIKKGS